ncbi:MAG: hypothetical protein ACK48G_00240 [Chitinophagaceae bacterium]|jgi:hypothetical protein
MRRCILIVVSCILAFAGCKESEQEPYFPLSNYLEAELQSIDSLPVAIIHYRTEGNESDTSIFEKVTFRKMVNGLLLDSVDSSIFSSQFTETVMEDVANELVTLSYVAQTSEQALKNIDIYVNARSSRVKRIYAERTETTPAVEIKRKMLWTPGKEWKITSIQTDAEGKIKTRTDQYTWGVGN